MGGMERNAVVSGTGRLGAAISRHPARFVLDNVGGTILLLLPPAA